MCIRNQYGKMPEWIKINVDRSLVMGKGNKKFRYEGQNLLLSFINKKKFKKEAKEKLDRFDCTLFDSVNGNSK